MSTIFADKFKNTSGGNNVKVNQLSGIGTAGSIAVQGEGTNTTNLQQGLVKQFSSFGQRAWGATAAGGCGRRRRNAGASDVSGRFDGRTRQRPC